MFYSIFRMRKKVIAVVILILVLGGVLAPACTEDSSVVLPSVEVREYKGENLSSINDFRENSIKGPQYVDLENYELKITGLVENPQSYTYNEILDNHKLYKKVVTLNCVEGWSVNILWEGVLVKDLIDEAKASTDANTIIFHAYDGYTTSLPIDYLVDQDIIMASKITFPDIFSH